MIVYSGKVGYILIFMMLKWSIHSSNVNLVKDYEVLNFLRFCFISLYLRIKSFLTAFLFPFGKCRNVNIDFYTLAW